MKAFLYHPSHPSEQPPIQVGRPPAAALPARVTTPASDLALLGHDLRAALAEVIGGLRLINPQYLDPATALQIERTRAASDALGLLVDQALAAILGEPTLPPLNPHRTVDTQRLLADLTLRWQGRTRDTAHSFLLDTAANLPERLTINSVLLERIIANLLENAVKYAGAGRIILRLFLKQEHLHLVVADEGAGFSPEVLSHSFAANCHTPNWPQTEGTTPGTGMGLHIVHQLASELGGRVLMQNPPQGGAEVQVILPHNPQAETDLLFDADLPDLAQKRVLVVDDSATNREMLRILLGRMGADVATAEDGVEAIERLASATFDLLIVDIEMPRLSGIDVIRHVRRNPGALRHLPVLAVTAYLLRANKLAIAAAGADAILAKLRLCPRNLARAIGRALPATARPANQAAALPELDVDQFSRLLALAGPVAAPELLNHLLADLTAAEYALLPAVERLDWPVVQRETHVLVSIAGAIGAKHLQAQAEALNRMSLAGGSGGPNFLTTSSDLLESLDTCLHFIGRQIGTAGNTQ